MCVYFGGKAMKKLLTKKRIVCLLLICVCIAIGLYNHRKNTPPENINTDAEQSSQPTVCRYDDCSNAVLDGKFYCAEHNCSNSYCYSPIYDNSNYCGAHKCIKIGCKNEKFYRKSYCIEHLTSKDAAKTTETPSTATPKTSASRKFYDPYDAEDYDNADDFADDWAEEFGYGDYEEGYDDAYDYWEEVMG